jgi:hypothetical protein
MSRPGAVGLAMAERRNLPATVNSFCRDQELRETDLTADGFAGPAAHIDDGNILSTQPAGQPSSVTTGAFDSHLIKLATLACPTNQLREAGRRRRYRAGAQQPATLVERRSHMLLGMRIYSERHKLGFLSRIAHCGRLPLSLYRVSEHQPGRRTDLR